MSKFKSRLPTVRSRIVYYPILVVSKFLQKYPSARRKTTWRRTLSLLWIGKNSQEAAVRRDVLVIVYSDWMTFRCRTEPTYQELPLTRFAKPLTSNVLTNSTEASHHPSCYHQAHRTESVQVPDCLDSYPEHGPIRLTPVYYNIVGIGPNLQTFRSRQLFSA